MLGTYSKLRSGPRLSELEDHPTVGCASIVNSIHVAQCCGRCSGHIGTFAAFVWTAAADPRSPQCWDCLQRLAMGFPAVNAQEDPSYEQGLTPGSVLPALANCRLDDGEIPTLQQIIKIFTVAQVENGGAAYVRDHLAQLPDVTADNRAKLVVGQGRTWTRRCATWWITVADCCCNRTSMRVPAWTGFCT